MDIHGPNDNCEWKPKMNMEFDSEDAAYNFYNEYGRRCGFSIRKETFWKNRQTGQLTSRLFVCSKEGVRKKRTRDQSPKNPRAETRCGCYANMGIKSNKIKGKYEINIFKEEHNHPLVPAECSHMLPSQRKISDIQAMDIDLAERSGIPLRSAYELFGRQAGGRECLGFTKLDQKNYLRGKRQKNLIYGEAGSIHKYFKQQSVANPSFSYDVQFDSDELITNIFWADARMIMDYSLFGDVVSFDTTYKINKEHRPFAVFVGFNHHRETIVFGAALMYDETTDSFKWLFRTFLEAMSKKQPRTILTDQDAAMAIAVIEEFPSTFHRLCKWHIMQNALKHTNNIGRTSSACNSSIKGMIAYFMDNIDDEDDFLDAWDKMLDEYDVRENRWLKGLFEVRQKWAHCYVSYHWSAGMKSTQLSESFNAALKNYLKSVHDVVQFFQHFERVLYDKRYHELNAEYNLCHRMPKVEIRVQMVEHAAQIYTKLMFEEFQEEYRRSIELITRSRDDGEDGKKLYTMGTHRGPRVWYVTKNMDNDVSCNCRHFETKGIICAHALKILREEMNAIEVPNNYILKRWTKDARTTEVYDMHGRSIEGDANLKESERAQNLCRVYMQIPCRAAQCEDAYTCALQNSIQLHKEVELIIKAHMERLASGIEDQSLSFQSLTNCDNASIVQAKGLKKRQDPFRGKKRTKSALETALIKRKKSSSQGNRSRC